LGPNGAGKTTFINILAGTTIKTSGKVNVWGFDLDKNPRQVRASIGIVPQEVNLDAFFSPKKLLELQAGFYGVPKKERITDTILKLVSLENQANAYARSLSGGMKRRVLIAKALSHEPSILFLDEPTAGVDVELRKDMWKIVEDLRKSGVTIILTTHYIEEAEAIADRIAIIDSGVIVENTTIKALLAKLDKETFVLDLKQPVQPISIAGYKYTLTDDHTLEVEVAKSQGLNHVFSALSEQGNTVLSMRNKANRLEELFVGLLEQGRGE
jgi:ABC-2 type transport system ATP-binding protein